MPKLKVNLDEQELEEAEWSEGDFESYEGEDPPKGTLLHGFVKKMWWTESQYGDDMLKILFVADGNTGDEEQYEGCPIWDNPVLTTEAKFRWAPFLETFGLKIGDVIKKTYVDEEENNGKPIIKIGNWKPGTDEAYCRVVTGTHPYNGAMQVDIAKWLEWEEPEEEPEDTEDEEEEVEEEPPARPSRRSRTSTPAPARGGRAASGRTARKAEPEPEEEEPEEAEEEEPEEAPARPTRRRAASGRAGTASRPATRAAGRPSRRGRGKSDEDDNEPPF